MLGPVSSHAAAETRQVVASLGSQPTVAGHTGDHPPDLETLRATPERPHQILIQGIICSLISANQAREGSWASSRKRLCARSWPSWKVNSATRVRLSARSAG